MTQTQPAVGAFDDAHAAAKIGDVLAALTGMPTPGTSSTPAQPATTGTSATPMTGSLEDGGYDGYGISQEYGVNGHPGLDIATPVGTKLISPIAGKVTHAANDDPSGYGQWVEVTGSDGTVVRYGHMSGMNVKVGDTVNPGTMLGLSGGAPGSVGAGNADGPHLHFEVHQAQGGPAVDPTQYLAGGWQILGAQ